MTKYRGYFIVALFIVLVIIYSFDNRQQYRIMLGKEACRSSERGNYEMAMEKYETYIRESPDESSYYWLLFSLFNEGSELTVENVKNSMNNTSLCLSYKNKSISYQ